MTSGRVASAAISMSFVVALGSASARADATKSQCVEANTKGQDLRRDGKLSMARDQFRFCADPSCPTIVRVDCTKRLEELEGSQPTIIFDAKDGSGHDLSAVAVTVDGHPLADRLDGSALRADPGEHLFVFTAANYQAPVRQSFVLKEGEKERRERIVVGSEAAIASKALPEVAPAPGSAPDAMPSSGGMRTQKVIGLVVAGVGVAGVTVGALFGLSAISKNDQQKIDCASATDCAHYSQAASAHSSAATDQTVSVIGFIAGGTLLVGAAVLFFTAPHPPESRTATRLLVLPAVGANSGGMFLKGYF